MRSSGFWRSDNGRSRFAYAALAALTVSCGLATRPLRRVIAPELAENIGDALWAVLIYLLVAFVWRRQGSGRIALAALMISVAVECSQLCHAPWIEAIRQTTLGGLVIGWGFEWSDLVAYASGIAGCVLLERHFKMNQTENSSNKDDANRI